ncbi:hypothetical protein [Sphingomonas sp. 1185]|uniref:hypothetical protein n=1 Tax=Sphingomonas sp. 1185 TaxID=3156411 RepID=UPI003392AB2A
MDDRSDGLLHQRLDRLEEKGRATLAAAARGAAWRDGGDLALRSSIVVPVVVAAWAMIRPVAALPAIAFSVVVPLVVMLLVVAVRMARFRVERRAALASVDRALALKDRAVVTAEFLTDDRPDGFRQAALQEAMPWLDRALSAQVDGEARSAQYGRYRWVMPILALAVLMAALAVRPSSSVGSGGGESSALHQVAMALGLRPDGRDPELDRDGRGGEGSGRDSSAGAAGRGATGGSPASAVGASAMAKAGGGSDDTARLLGQSQSVGSGASPSSGSGRANGVGSTGRMGEADSTGPSGKGPDGQRAEDAKTRGDGQAMAAESRATPPQGAQNGAAAGVSAPAGSPPAPRNPGGSQGPQSSGSRNRQQSGQQSQGSGSSGRANNNGQQGSNRGDGQEGAKRARGSSSLMLAVPMEDRVIGTVNAGTVSSTTRNAPPRAMTAGAVAAQSRGAGQGPDASLPERTRSVQEDRLLERYFARPGVGR